MKKAILGIFMLMLLPGVSMAQSVPEHYRSDVILNYCGDTITATTARQIQSGYYRFKGKWRFLINASYKAYMFGGDAARLANYCSNLQKAVADPR